MYDVVSSLAMTAAATSTALWVLRRVLLPLSTKLHRPPDTCDTITVVFDPRAMRVVRIVPVGCRAWHLPHHDTWCVPSAVFEPAQTSLTVTINSTTTVVVTYHLERSDVARYLTVVGPQPPSTALALTVTQVVKEVGGTTTQTQGGFKRALEDAMAREHALTLDTVA